MVISDNYRKIDRDVGDDSYAFPDNKIIILLNREANYTVIHIKFDLGLTQILVRLGLRF